MRTQIFMGKRKGARMLVTGGRRGRSTGFTYIGLLLLVASMGFALTVVAQVWQTAQIRDKEEELLFVGNEFRRAIGMYVAATSRYPHSLEDLLKDPGFPGVRRYLRKIYRDPITGRAEWGLVKAEGNAIIGVHSLSEAAPMKQGGFSLADQGFEAKKKYAEWVFVSKVGQTAPGAIAPSAAQGSGALGALPSALMAAGAIAPSASGNTLSNSGQIQPSSMGIRFRR